MQPAEFAVDAAPGRAGAAFGDPDQQQRQPAQQDVGADAGFEPVEHRAQLDGRLQVAEPAFGLEQVLVWAGAASPAPDTAKDAEILVLRHEGAVLRRPRRLKHAYEREVGKSEGHAERRFYVCQALLC